MAKKLAIVISDTDLDDVHDVDEHVQKMFDSTSDDDTSDSDFDVLETINAANQQERANAKLVLAAKKVQAAKDAEKKKADALALKKEQAAKKADALALKKKKKEAALKKKKRKKAVNKKPTTLKVGMRVCGRWNGSGPSKGRWFDGTVLKVFPKKKSVHMRFDDGDEDDNLSWDHVSIIDDIEKDG